MPSATPLPSAAQEEKKVIKKATNPQTSTVKEKIAEKPITKTGEKTTCYHDGFVAGSMAHIYIQYACDISNYDVDFILTMNAENGGWNMNRASDLIGKNGYRDYGLCQINKGWHPEIVNDERFFTDYKRQIEQCRKLYNGGTRFFGYDKRNERAKGYILIGAQRF